jgi:hypothetical protein
MLEITALWGVRIPIGIWMHEYIFVLPVICYPVYTVYTQTLQWVNSPTTWNLAHTVFVLPVMCYPVYTVYTQTLQWVNSTSTWNLTHTVFVLPVMCYSVYTVYTQTLQWVNSTSTWNITHTSKTSVSGVYSKSVQKSLNRNLMYWYDRTFLFRINYSYTSTLIPCVWRLISAYLKCLEKLQECANHTRTRKKVHINIRPSTAPKATPPQSFRFSSVGVFKNPSVFSSNWKRTDTAPEHFLCLSNHSKSPRYRRNSATVHDQTCSCRYCFRWRIFWASIVKCDFIKIRTQQLLNWERVLWMYDVSLSIILHIWCIYCLM